MKHLLAIGHRIRIVDITESCAFGTIPDCEDVIVGDLGDQSVCVSAVQDVHTVLHLAANMGGMGTIHSQNDFVSTIKITP